MAKPSIFISHSAKDDFAIQVRDTLYAKLVKMGFDVLMDKERLEIGTAWRKMIREWIQQCNAAIILFSKDALDSPWVLFEATILLTRREEEQTFDVFPVRFASVSREELDKSRFAPLVISDFQAVTGDTLDAIINPLLEQLAPLKNIYTEGPLSQFENRGEAPPGFTLRYTLPGHSSTIARIAWSSDGQILASSSFDRTVRLWNTKTGKTLRTLKGHSDAVFSVAWSPYEEVLASGSRDNTIRLWEAKTGKTLRTLKGHAGTVWSIAWSPNGEILASGSNDQTICLWDAKTGKKLQTLKGDGSVNSVAWSPDGSILASGFIKRTICLWNTRTWQPSRTLRGHGDSILSVLFAPDGRTLATASQDETIRLWDPSTGKRLRILKGHTAILNCLSYSFDGKILASKSGDGTVRLWDTSTSKTVVVLKEPASNTWLGGLAFHPKEFVLVTLDEEDTVIRVWDLDAAAILGSDSTRPHDLADDKAVVTLRERRQTMLSYEAYISEKTTGFTGREWIFQAVDAWLADSTGPRFFFITGEPGSGKTAIASRLAQFALGMVPLPEGLTHLAPDFLGAIHFCSALNRSSINPLAFAESLAMQLAERYQEYANALVEQAENHRVSIDVTRQVQNVAGKRVTGIVIKSLSISGVAPQKAFNQLVCEPLEACFRQEFNQQQVIILVDALDEALDYHDNVDIVSLLALAKDLHSKVRFIVTTRLDPRVPSLLQPSREVSLTTAVGLSNSMADVREYVYRRLQGVSDPRKGEVLEQMVEAARGNFLYASFALDDLLSDPERIGNNISLLRPGSLFEHYQQFIERILTGNTHLWVQTYRPLLGTIAVACGDGLTRAQLAGILGFSNSRTDELLSDCAQLLSSQGPDGAFRIYHQSFRDYLLSDGMYQIDSASANLAIAKYFLDTYGNRWLDCQDDYALRYTPTHLIEAARQSNQEGADKELIDILAKLLSDQDFVKATIQRNGMETLLTDLINALQLFPPTSDQSQQLLVEMLPLGTTLAQTGQWELAEATWTEIETVARAIVDTVLRDRIFDALGTALARLGQWEHAEAVVGAIENERQRGNALNDLGTALAQAGQQVHADVVLAEARGLMQKPGITTDILRGHNGPVRTLAVTPDGSRAISGSEDNMLKVWDLYQGEELLTFTGHSGAVTSVAVTPNALLAISASDDSTVKVWELATGSLLVNLAHEGAVNAIVVTLDGQYVVSASDDFTARVFELPTGHLLTSVTHSGPVRALAVTPDGRYVVSASDDSILTIWDRATGSFLASYQDSGLVRALAVTPDGRYVVSACDDSAAKVLELPTGHLLTSLRHSGPVRALAVTPDGRYVVSASDDSTLSAWELATGSLVHNFRGHAGSVRTVMVSPDGRYALSSADDLTLKAWDLQKGSEVYTFTGHYGPVLALAVTPDGRMLVTGSDDTTVRLWDLQQLSLLRPSRISRQEALKRVELVQGDLLDLSADALVHAVGLDLWRGGALSAQLLVRGGPELARQLQSNRVLAPSETLVTDAGLLLARYLIHVATEDRFAQHSVQSVTRGARAALATAEGLSDVRSLAFPSLGTGAAGLDPVDTAPEILMAVVNHLEQGSRMERVIFAFLDEIAYQAYVQAYQELVRRTGTFYRLMPEAPEKAIVGQKIKLQVRLRPGVDDDAFELPSGLAELYCFVSSSDRGLRIRSTEVATIPIAAQSSELAPASFELQASLPGLREYTIDLFMEEPSTYRRIIHRARGNVTVEAPEVGAPARLPQAPPLDLRVTLQPPFVLQVDSYLPTGVDGSHELTYRLTSRLPGLTLRNEEAGRVTLPAGELTRIRTMVVDMLKRSTQMQPVDAHAQLLDLGTYLFDRLFPADRASAFRTAYWQVAEAITTWLIVEDGITWLPWELVAPYREENPPRLLGERYQLGRWVDGLGTTLYSEVPVGGIALAFYQDLGEALDQQRLGGWKQILSDNLFEGIMGVAKPENPFYGLHLLRHVERVGSQEIAPWNAGNGNEPLPPNDLMQREITEARLDLRLKRPIVTFSMLYGEDTSPDELVKDWPLPKRVLPFLQAGASAVIGPWWPTSEASDRVFWSTFYDSLIVLQEALGEAIRSARQAVARFAPGQPDWLAYTLFGNPRARPDEPETSGGYTALECLNSDEPLRAGKTYYFRASIRVRPPMWHEDRLVSVQAGELLEQPMALFMAPGIQRTIPEPIAMTPYGRMIRFGQNQAREMLQATQELTPEEDGEYLLTVHVMDGKRVLQSLQLPLVVGVTESEMG